MFDSKFYTTMAALVVAVYAICNLSKNKVTSNEGFFPGQISHKAETVAYNPNTKELMSLPNGYQAQLAAHHSHKMNEQEKQKMEMFNQHRETFVPTGANYQSMLAPRMNPSEGYNSTIRYNPPAIEHMAVPCNPLTFASMAGNQENYEGGNGSCGGCGPQGCAGVNCPTGGQTYEGFQHHNQPHHNQTHQQNHNQIAGNPTVPDNITVSFTGLTKDQGIAAMSSDTIAQGGGHHSQAENPGEANLLPIATMDSTSLDGSSTEPAIIYDRMIYAGRMSRNYANGDFFRGDLAIVPNQNGWFNVSAVPKQDLNPGAINVMAGNDNGSANALAELISATSGDSTFAGVPMSSISQTQTGSALADVTVASFP